MDRTTLGIPIVRVRCSEITTNYFQRNLACRSKPETAQHWYWGTPSLYGVLKEKPTDYQGDCKPPFIDYRTKEGADRSESGGICFEHSLYIPLLIQLS
jgi:hypothetical protein